MNVEEWDGHNFLYKCTKRDGHLKCETGSACQKLYCTLGELKFRICDQ